MIDMTGQLVAAFCLSSFGLRKQESCYWFIRCIGIVAGRCFKIDPARFFACAYPRQHHSAFG
ncbi:hypothetical protein [Sphingopyxis sp. 550A]